MEDQAFGRVYRMGQKKETFMGRMVVWNTVDKRLANLQDRKLKLIGKMILDHDSSRENLSMEEIAALLGRVVRDEHGKIVRVEADYDDESNEGGSDRGNSSQSETDTDFDNDDSSYYTDSDDDWEMLDSYNQHTSHSMGGSKLSRKKPHGGGQAGDSIFKHGW